MENRAETAKNASGFNAGNVTLISTAHFVHDVYSSFLAPILPLLIDKFGMNYTMAGLLAVAQRAPALSNPLLGLLADRIRMRFLLIPAPALTAISMSLLGMAPNYGTLVLLLIAMGLSSMSFHVPAPVMIRQVSGDRVGRGMSFLMVGGEVARCVGPLVILAAVAWWGLEGTWRLIPFGLAASFFLFLRFRKLSFSVARNAESAEAPVGRLMKRFAPFFLILTGFTLSRAFLKSALTIFLPVYVAQKGGSLWFAGISLSVLELAGAVGTFWGGSLSDRIGRRATLLLVSVLSPLLGWAFLFTTGPASIAVLLVLGFFIFAGSPVLLALVQDVKSERPAFLNALYMTLNFLTTSITAFAIGWFSDKIGLNATFHLSVLLSLPAVAFVWALSERHVQGRRG